MTSRPRLAGAGALLLALGILIGTATGGTLAAFSRTTANTGSSFVSDRVFPAGRSSSAWDLRDASGGGAETNSSAPQAYGEGMVATTGNWAAAFSSTRYLEYDMNSSLPAGLVVTGAQFKFRFVPNAGTDSGCYYFETRVASTGAVIGTHGSSGSPVACLTGTQQTTVSTSISEIDTTDEMNNLRIRVYGREDNNRPFKIDMATVSGSTPYRTFTLYRTVFTDASTGTASSSTWSLVSADSTAYASAANWLSAFSSARYLKFTFPSYVPAGATVTSAVLDHTYKSNTNGDTTCVYFEASSGATLLNTFGSSGTPLSCNSTTAYATDQTTLLNVDTPGEVNGLLIKMFVRNSGGRRSLHDQAKLTVTYSLDGSASCADPETITYPVTGDTWVRQDQAANNFGTDTLLDVQTQNGSRNRRALVQTDLPEVVPANCTMIATLSVYGNSVQGTRTLQAYQVTSSWAEGSVTWSSMPTFGGTPATTSNATGWRTWTVTSIVTSMMSGTNYGFLIKDSAEDNAGALKNDFQSKENASGNVPYLSVTFS